MTLLARILIIVTITSLRLSATTTGSIIQVDSGFTETITGVISGTGFPSKTGAGTLVLGNAANSFSGAQIELAAGTLTWTATNNITTAAGNNSYIGQTRSFTWVTGATSPILQLGGNIGVSGTTALGTLTATTLATVNGAFSWFPAAFSGAGGLTVGTGTTVDLRTGTVTMPAGAGNYIMNGTFVPNDAATTGTGTMTVNNGGTLNASYCATQLSSAIPSGVLTVNAGGILRLPAVTGNWTKAIVLS
jgi:fibronectin-binding autotransporter adhesin